MKILHCCLSCFYIDDYGYQENLLPLTNKEDGHAVRIIASTETFVGNARLGYVEPGTYFSKDGIEIVRVPYKRYLPHLIIKKIRHYNGVFNLIKDFSPDVILFHGVPALELLTIKKYKKDNPEVKFYVDSHEDFHNTATNFLSKYLLHKIYYKNIIRRTLPHIDKVLCVSYESFSFLKEMYNVPGELMEFFPLGGILVEEEQRRDKREKIRQELGLKEEDILLIHSGKMDKLKRTQEIIEAFKQVPNECLHFAIIGAFTEETKENSERLIVSDKRIRFLGWKSGDELLDYLCASDLYVQPGTQSATMQNAVCCGSALALYPYPSHKYLFEDSVFYIETIDDMVRVFQMIANNRELLENKRLLSYKVAKEKLDYKVLAARLYR